VIFSYNYDFVCYTLSTVKTVISNEYVCTAFVRLFPPRRMMQLLTMMNPCGSCFIPIFNTCLSIPLYANFVYALGLTFANNLFFFISLFCFLFSARSVHQAYGLRVRPSKSPVRVTYRAKTCRIHGLRLDCLDLIDNILHRSILDVSRMIFFTSITSRKYTLRFKPS